MTYVSLLTFWSTDTSDPGHYGTSAEMSIRHFGLCIICSVIGLQCKYSDCLVLRHQCRSVWTLRSCRSVLGPNFRRSEVSVHRHFDGLSTTVTNNTKYSSTKLFIVNHKFYSVSEGKMAALQITQINIKNCKLQNNKQHTKFE